jgi:hypothetical protein
VPKFKCGSLDVRADGALLPERRKGFGKRRMPAIYNLT